MSNKIPFTEEAVKEYLATNIRYWRKRKSPGDFINHSKYYIDVYQNLYSSLFGELYNEDELKQGPTMPITPVEPPQPSINPDGSSALKPKTDLEDRVYTLEKEVRDLYWRMDIPNEP